MKKEFQRLLKRFNEREQYGAIRECHGDLHAGNIFINKNHLEVFDAIDFNPKLRWIDPISEISFLVMDLQTRGHQIEAMTLLNKWLELTGDYNGLELFQWYSATELLLEQR